MTVPINNFFVPHSVMEDIKFINLPASTQMLYIHYCKLANRHADGVGWFWRSIAQICKDTDFDKKTVISGNKRLLENEFIDVKTTFFAHSKKKTYNSYRLNGFRFRGGGKNGT